MATSTSSSSKRHSVLPPISQAGPKPPVNFSSSIVIADSAVLTGTGTITVGSESAIHPRARLDSSSGNITIGRRCITYERSCVGAAAEHRTGSDRGSADGGERRSGGVTLGDYVTVEVGAVVEAGGTVVGEGSLIGAGARIGAGAIIGKHCTVTAMTVVPPGERVPDLTVLFSNGSRRTDRSRMSEMRSKVQVRQLEVIRRIVPSNPAKFQS